MPPETMLRGHSYLTGRAFGALLLRTDEVLAENDAAAVLAAVDRERGTLRDDERVLFLLGYEASLTLDPRAPRRAHDPRLGPSCFAWRCRVVDAAAAPRLLLSSSPSPLSPSSSSSAPAPLLALSTTRAARAAHLERITAARELLLDGVIYQANLAHPLVVGAQDFDAGVAFFASRARGPAAAALVDVPGWGSLVSLSPERFVVADLAAHEARTYPIKGTVPRGASVFDDERLRDELLSSAKDRAEHLMIVDLLRNDLGRLAVAGGVTVEHQLALLSTPSVHHLETTIHARLLDDVGVDALMRATAPGGSITGAPKSSAVEAIHALESVARGAYTGVLGVVDGRGRFVSSLLIRTWLRADAGPGTLHVGGGIVVDSEPELEWQETLHKARAFGDVDVRVA